MNYKTVKRLISSVLLIAILVVSCVSNFGSIIEYLNESSYASIMMAVCLGLCTWIMAFIIFALVKTEYRLLYKRFEARMLA